jgi:hypothetical protein
MTKITLDRRGLDAILAALDAGLVLRIGPDNPETALYGAIHETGGVSPRDGWLSQAIAAQQPAIEAALQRAAEALLMGDTEGAQAQMKALGVLLEDAVRASIDERQLIDTGALRASITSEVSDDPDG